MVQTSLISHVCVVSQYQAHYKHTICTLYSTASSTFMEKLQNYKNKALSHRGYELAFSQTSVRFLHSLSCMFIQTKISEVKPIVSLRFLHFQINFLALLGR